MCVFGDSGQKGDGKGGQEGDGVVGTKYHGKDPMGTFPVADFQTRLLQQNTKLESQALCRENILNSLN